MRRAVSPRVALLAAMLLFLAWAIGTAILVAASGVVP